MVRPEQRAAGIGLWGASAALAAACGPVLGGVLVEVADWRWIFMINLRLGAVLGTALLVAIIGQPASIVEALAAATFT